MDAARDALNRQLAKAQQAQANLELLQHIAQHTCDQPCFVDADVCRAAWTGERGVYNVVLNGYGNFLKITSTQLRLNRDVRRDLPPREIAEIINGTLERCKTLCDWRDKLNIIYGGTDMDGWLDWCDHVEAVRKKKEMFESLLERVQRPGVAPPTLAAFCKGTERFIAQWSSDVFLCVGVDNVIVHFQGCEKRFASDNNFKVWGEIADEVATHLL